jgi:hypothetical protein
MTFKPLKKHALVIFKIEHPTLYDQLLHVVSLTRQLHFKYHFMGNLLMNEDPSTYQPNVKDSVIKLYLKEIQLLKDNDRNGALQNLLAESRHHGYAKICLLVLGNSPESLIGASFIK